MKKPVQLSQNLYLIDAMDLGMEQRTGSYIINEDSLTLIETSASPSVPHILKGIEQLGYTPADIKYIIVTHIHLDHAGGAGLLLEHCPNAKVVVHPKGARHLVDPSRLIAGARAVYGDKFDELFDPILPIPEERLIVKQHGETLPISPNCLLEFYNTPGHANHHFSIYYPSTNGIFAGDTAGIFYPQLLGDHVELYMPSTSPNQFDPKKMLQSIELFESKNLDYIYFGHYGASKNPNEAFKQVRYWLEIFISEGKETLSGTNNPLPAVTAALMEKVSTHLLEKGIERTHPVYDILSLDLGVSAMGLIDFLQKQEG